MDYIPISKDEILMTLMDNWVKLDVEEDLLVYEASKNGFKKNINAKLKEIAKKKIINFKSLLNRLEQKYPKNSVADILIADVSSRIKYLSEIFY